MAGENGGEVVIGFSVNDKEAQKALKKIGEGFDKVGKSAGKSGNDSKKGLNKTEDAAEGAGQSVEELSKTTDELRTALRAALTESSNLNDTLDDTPDEVVPKKAFVGLKDLKDNSGEASSSMSSLAGAVSIVSPELGSAMSGASALAGGLEGASKAAVLFGGSMRTMLLAAGPIAAVLLGAAAAMAFFKKQAEEADAAMGHTVERVNAMSDIAAATRDLRIETAIATGGMTEYEAAIQQVTIQRARDQTAIQTARHALGQLTGEALASAEQELDSMSALADERQRLGRLRTDLAEEERMIAAEAARQAEADADAAVASADAAQRQARQQAEASAELAAARQEEARAQALVNAERTAELLLLSDADPLQAAYLKSLDNINKLQQQGVDPQLIQGLRDRASLTLETGQAALEAAEQFAAGERIKGAAADESAKALQRQAEAQATVQAALSAFSQASSGYVALMKASGIESAQLAKALGATEITIAGIVAGARVFKDLPFPLAVLAAGGIAAGTAASLAELAATPTTMHSGGMVGGVGDVPIKAQGGEAILNRQAVANIGEGGVNALNAGGGSSAPVVVQMTYKQKVFDRVVIDNLRKGGPMKNAINRAERRGRRGRVGGIL